MFVHDFFISIAGVVAQDPNRPALTEGDRNLSYADLVSLTDLIRLQFKGIGVEPGDRVGIYLTNSAVAYAAIFACILCGATYVPLATDDPEARLRQVIEEAQLKAVIGLKTSPNSHQLLSKTVAFIELDEDALFSQITRPTRAFDLSELTDTVPLYILFTSGSTGRPKGVPIDSVNVGEFSKWARDYFAIESSDVFLGITRLTFDLSVFNLFLPFWCGASVLIARQVIEQLNPTRLLEKGVTVALTVPRITGLVFDEQIARESKCFPRLRHLLFCGEQLFAAQVHHWMMRNPRLHVHNCYGPTEATVACTCHSFSPGDVVADPVSIGRALPGQRMDLVLEDGSVLDGAGQGELVISGSQVSRFGYWRTASNRFYDDPQNGRSFKSGDLVRRDNEGLLYWLARIDEQIKIKGYRVDLGEIEQALSSVEGVRDLICLFDVERQVVTAVYSSDKSGGLREIEAALKSQAERSLPIYMRPYRFVAVGEVPRTKNGKADRRAAQALVEADGL